VRNNNLKHLSHLRANQLPLSRAPLALIQSAVNPKVAETMHPAREPIRRLLNRARRLRRSRIYECQHLTAHRAKLDPLK
jgi:hypothetical protein